MFRRAIPISNGWAVGWHKVSKEREKRSNHVLLADCWLNEPFFLHTLGIRSLGNDSFRAGSLSLLP